MSVSISLQPARIAENGRHLSTIVVGDKAVISADDEKDRHVEAPCARLDVETIYWPRHVPQPVQVQLVG